MALSFRILQTILQLPDGLRWRQSWLDTGAGGAAVVPPSATTDGGEFSGDDNGIFADAVENRSGAVDRVRLLAISNHTKRNDN